MSPSETSFTTTSHSINFGVNLPGLLLIAEALFAAAGCGLEDHASALLLTLPTRG
jgi:hypothetical protein